jgi:hypothetical protein
MISLFFLSTSWLVHSTSFAVQADVAAEAIPYQQATKTAGWTITAVVQRPDGSPAAGVEVYVFPFKDGNLLHGIGMKEGKFGLSNPGAKTDATGRFRIEIPEAYLKGYGTDDFTVGVFELATPDHPAGLARPFRDEDRAQAMPILNTKLFKQKPSLDLNEIWKRIVIGGSEHKAA